MNNVAYPGSRVSPLSKLVRIPTSLARELASRAKMKTRSWLLGSVYRFVYYGDGLATTHYSPFLTDPAFNERYAQVSSWWFDRPVDVRWRAWLLTRCAAQCRALRGSFVEFGVYRAGYAFMILSTASLHADQRFYLFDTFKGIPRTNLTETEARAGFAKRLDSTSLAHVREVLAEWSANIVLVEGDIFDTLLEVETGEIAFCHLDLNASAPTKRALEYLYPRLVPGGMIVMDDYGFSGYEEQRSVLDAFFADKPEELIALPTGQGVVVKI